MAIFAGDFFPLCHVQANSCFLVLFSLLFFSFSHPPAQFERNLNESRKGVCLLVPGERELCGRHARKEEGEWLKECGESRGGRECRFELCHWSLFQIQREIAMALPWHFTQSLFDMDKQLFFLHEIFHIRIFRSLSVSQRAGMDICVLPAHPFLPP